jgi:hypothetical protein
MHANDQFMAGIEAFENVSEEIQKKKDRLAEVRVVRQAGSESQFDFGLWNAFSHAWNERPIRRLDEANNEDQREEWVTAIGGVKPSIVGWYPSSSTDLRPLLISRTATLKLGGRNYSEPNLWIFSDDVGSQWSDFNEGTLFDEARTGLVGLIQQCWKLDPDLPKVIGPVEIPQTASEQRYSRLLRVALEPPGEPPFATYILLLHEDDSVVSGFLENHGLPITHAVFTVGMVSPFLNADDVFEKLEILGARWIFDQRGRCPQGWEAKDRILRCGNGGGNVNLVERLP